MNGETACGMVTNTLVEKYNYKEYNKDMNEDELLKITSSIEEKLGKDNAGIIADDLGLLLTRNTETVKSIQDKDAEIESLKSRNEKLVTANGNLLQQIPVANTPAKKDVDDEEDEKPFSWRDQFNDRGEFI